MSDLAKRIAGLTPEQRGVLARRMKSGPPEAAPAIGPEPLAVIGLGCRLPGGADTPEAFWRLLRDGVDAITEVPSERWDAAGLYDPDYAVPGKMNSRWGGFLRGVDRFDAGFFGISPREAARMDPQQRLLLEVAWEALEDAGQPLEKVSGSAAGVFVGIHSQSSEYCWLQIADRGRIDTYTGTGTAHSIVANRLSYLLDLRGPSVAVDTACSSSLVAVHLACQSLRSRECDLALAGGVNLVLSPEMTIAFSKLQMMAADGRCKTFDARADGFVRGEGCGVVVLKRLSEALADGDDVLAVIRGSAVNQDGRTNGLTAPSGLSQEVVVRRALKDAGLSSADVTYVEAHGTGTALGDPIEVEALAAAFSDPRPRGRSCALGSVKANMGHLEAAAGIAGLIKVVLCMRQQAIPPHLHFTGLNPHIRLEGTPFTIAPEGRPWLRGDEPRSAGVSSFGFGGTNAHVVLSEAPPAAPPPPRRPEPHTRVVPLSARSPEALRALAGAYVEALGREAEAGLSLMRVDLGDVCRTAALRRTHHDHRLAVVARSPEELAARLGAFLEGERGPGVAAGAAGERRGGLAFVFSGQGPQWHGMGRELLAQEPVFREALERCDALVGSRASWSLLEELRAEEGRSRLDQTEVAQPAIFALQVGLAALWRSWGVVPEVVVGHSIGEVAAAHVAGILDLEDAVHVVVQRGRLMQRATGGGRMASVALGLDEARRAMAGLEDRVSVAAMNAPASTVLSGETASLEALLEGLRTRGVDVRMLRVNYAFHSPQMEPVRAELVAALRGIEPRRGSVPMISTVTGQAVEGPELDASYWGRNIRAPVAFAAAVEAVAQRDAGAYLEIGPHPVLGASLTDCLGPASEALVLASLRRGQEERATLLASLAALHVRGFAVDWRAVAGPDGRCVKLPSYPWQRQRHWLEAAVPTVRPAEAVEAHPDGSRVHPLLGRRISAPVGLFESRHASASLAELDGHRLWGIPVMPVTTYLEMALAAAREVLGERALALHDVVLHEALALPDGEFRRVQLMLGEEEAGGTPFRIFSASSAETGGSESWTRHASGRVVVGRPMSADPWDADTARRRCRIEESGEEFYGRLRDRGFDLGSSCCGLERLWKGEGEALGRLKLAAAPRVDDRLDASALMSAFQLSWAVLPGGEGEKAWFPSGLESFRLEAPLGAARWAHARLRPGSPDASSITADLRLVDADGRELAAALGVAMRRAGRELLRSLRAPRDWMYEVAWEPRPRASAAVSASGRPDALERIAASAPTYLERHFASEGASRYQALHRGLEALATEYVTEALRDLGLELRPGRQCSAVSLGVPPARRRLLARFLEMLAEDGVVRADGDELQVLRPPAAADPEGRRRALEEAFPDFGAELALVAGCGKHLADVLRGRCDPLGLLFPDGSLALVERLYQDSPLFGAFNALVRETVARAVESLPPEATVRVLELGAGTGGTTSHVLPSLPRDRAEYVFTDVSTAFLTRAREKFAAYPFVRYALLDVEGGVEEQGFEAHAYDVVLAANVLHASRDLRRSLRLAARLLAPGGTLVLFEVTARQRWVDSTFGLTEGWWRFDDADLRPSHPLLSPSQWRGALQDAGFTGGLSLPPGDDARQAVIVARAGGAETPPAPPAAETWWILGDRGGVGHALAEGLRSRGRDARLVLAGDTTRDDGEARVDPLRPEALASLVQGASGVGGRAAGVVHLWALDTPSDDELGPAELEASQRLLCGSALHLGRALAASNDEGPPRMWIVTRGAQPVGTEPVCASQAPLWGLGRVVALEHPQVWGGLVDLDPASSPAQSAAALLEEILGADDEDQSAVRDGQRYVPRLVPAVSTWTQDARFRSDAAYLVTGGLGGLGLKVARWIAERGGRHLVLVSRRGLPPRENWPALVAGTDEHRRVAAVRSLEEMGARVTAVAADVGDAPAMEGLFGRFGATEPPLKGIVHAAAELGSSRLGELDVDGLLSVLRPKVQGAFLLDRLSRGLELDFFVLFSSTTALWGSAGLAHYAAANQYLDALAHRRRAHGLPALSINWGTWDEMRSFSAEEKDTVSRFGLRPMASSQALAALEELLGSEAAQRAVAAVDWVVLKDAYEARRRRPFLSRVGGEVQGRAAAPPRPGILARFEAAAADERPYLLAEHVRDEVARVLGLDPSHPLETDRGFFEIGMDSLTSAELRRRLERSLGRPLPPTLTFNYPNVDALTGYLAGVLIPGAPPPAAARPPVGPETVASPTDLSEEELTAMLADRLRRLQ